MSHYYSAREMICLVRALSDIFYATSRKRISPIHAVKSSIDSSSYLEKTKSTELQCIRWANGVRDNIACGVYTIRDFMHHQIVSLMFKKDKKKYRSTPYFERDAIKETKRQFLSTTIEHDTKTLREVINRSDSRLLIRFIQKFPWKDEIPDEFVTENYSNGKSLLFILLEEKIIGFGLYFQVIRKAFENYDSFYEQEIFGDPELIAIRFATLTKTIEVKK